jgi:hypothetical protein
MLFWAAADTREALCFELIGGVQRVRKGVRHQRTGVLYTVMDRSCNPEEISFGQYAPEWMKHCARLIAERIWGTEPIKHLKI